jgi:hypothetical protein
MYTKCIYHQRNLLNDADVLLLAATETCPLYPAHYIHQTVQLTAQESVRFVSVLVPHRASESAQAIAESLTAVYEPRETGVGTGYAVTVSLRFGGANITATMQGVGTHDSATTYWRVKRKTLANASRDLK